MKRSWFPSILVAGLLGLLVLLAGLQYNWLGKISEDERERMQRRVETDAQRFAEDFNREIQTAYYNFQTESDIWQQKKWTEFNERYEFWRAKSAYPNLIKNFYYWQNQENAPLLFYDSDRREFVETAWTDELKNLQTKAADEKNFQPVQTENYTLVMPVQEVRETFDRILISKDSLPPEVELPKKTGFLIIAIDESVIKNQLFPELVNKYFPDKDYNVAVREADERTVFQTEEVNSSDAKAKLFDLSANNFILYSRRDAQTKVRRSETKSVAFSKRFENKTISRVESETFKTDTPDKNITGVKIEMNGERPRTTILETKNPDDKGVWTLNVQHVAGSLEKYATNTRRKNLGMSFGILSLLAVSIILIFASSQRAKLLAQRQVEFVSSVSHEFRTPLAVIYSAGENLADGVAKEQTQVSRYGDLIKGEGKKLSRMVEQILEFAGANSGRKKYDLREVAVAEIIEKAIAECQPMIKEKNYTIEREVGDNLPVIIADKNALSQAVQNLIANSIKYSNGNHWLKVSAKNGDGKIKIIVEDKGIGISAKDLRQIFEPFYRAKSVVDEQIHGSGLGLSLVKQTVEAHGGRVWAESELKKGSKFTIHLPLNI